MEKVGGARGSELSNKKEAKQHSPVNKDASKAEILKQALAAKDKKLIKNAINSRDPTVARSTVAALSGSHAAAFFEEIANLVIVTSSSSAEFQKWLLWLREVLLQHSPSLTKSPNSKKCLDNLYKHCTARVGHEESLIRLLGIVDTAVFNSDKSIQLSRLVDKMASDAREPLTLYMEGANEAITLQEVLEASPTRKRTKDDLAKHNTKESKAERKRRKRVEKEEAEENATRRLDRVQAEEALAQFAGDDDKAKIKEIALGEELVGSTEGSSSEEEEVGIGGVDDEDDEV